MLDFVGNSEFFNEGFGYSERALAVDGEGHGLHSRAEMQTLEGEDAWIRREWLDVEPGAEAVDLSGILLYRDGRNHTPSEATSRDANIWNSHTSSLCSSFWR